MLPRPLACEGCDLHPIATGYAPPEGDPNAWALIVCEALGGTEAAVGRPLVGDAGGMFQRLLNMLGWAREDLRIINVAQCRPPHDWFDERAPYFRNAIRHCAVHRDPVIREPHQVIIPMGNVALKTLLDLHGARDIRIEDFHGTLNRDYAGRLIVPTYHPSFLQRGAHNLMGTVLWDLARAKEYAQHPPLIDPGSLVIDPPVGWFAQWVDTVLAASRQDRQAYPVSVDIETPEKATGKSEGEISTKDDSYTILRVNVSCHPDEGVTVPFVEPYVSHLKRLLSEVVCWLWYKGYDLPRLIAAETCSPDIERRAVDLMNLAHFLQSDVPLGLGFWAPFYSTFGAWKHLAGPEPARYAAIDGLQTHRCGFGITSDLQTSGQYAQAIRHQHLLHWAVLKPAQDLGVRIDRERLVAFGEKLLNVQTDRLAIIQDLIPEEVLPLTPEHGLVSRPLENVLHAKATAFTRTGKQKKGKAPTAIKADLYRKARIIERIVLKEILVCEICGEKEVVRKHRCKKPYTKKDGTTGWKPADYDPKVTIQVASVTRYFWQEPFNPDSWQQILGYLKAKGHTPGKAKKTHKDTTNRETLEKLSRSTKDPFYSALLDYRAVTKVKGTYVDGTEKRLDENDRVHPVPTFRPSTHRLSYVDPNITNVVSDRGGPESLASGFRSCIVAGPDCRLLEVDFGGIEAVEVGWFSGAPDYIRLAKLGVHAGLASHVLGRPYDPKWSDADLSAYFGEIKESHDHIYNQAKRFVHGSSYGLTLHGMVLQFPDIFPNLKAAEKIARAFKQLAPKIPDWQHTVRQIAQRQHYLGGPGAHPFGYKHWFWSVHTYKRLTSAQYAGMIVRGRKHGLTEEDLPITNINGQWFKVGLGEDGKRVVAFFPQSTAAGVLKEAMLRLFLPESPSYIGDAYYGQTPLRAPIHDSLLLEVPVAQWDRVCEKVFQEMLRPIAQQPMPLEWGLGDYLSIGIAAKASPTGGSWADCRKIKVPGMADLGLAHDSVIDLVGELEDEEDRWGLRRAVA